MSSASSESEQEVKVLPKQKVRKSKKQRNAPQKESDEECLAEKFKNILSSSTNGDDSDCSHHSDLDEDDEIELDENGCVKDFNLIADALEDRKVENKTFNDFELRDIERKNTILMKKILSHNRRPSQYKVDPIYHKASHSSVNRKKQQQKIDRENLMLLKKIQSVKPFGLSKPKK